MLHCLGLELLSAQLNSKMRPQVHLEIQPVLEFSFSQSLVSIRSDLMADTNSPPKSP